MSSEATCSNSLAPPEPVGTERWQLAQRYRDVRRLTEQLSEPLTAEDCVVQSMPDASPAKWHLAHTTWYFETFVLQNAIAAYTPVHPQYSFLFNSYYNAVGDRHPRPQRGLLTRPSLDEVLAYRREIDQRVQDLLVSGRAEACLPIVELGLHHEQQHQELLLTDIKHLLSCNPLRPVYAEAKGDNSNGRNSALVAPPPIGWVEFPAGVHSIGHTGRSFAFDNESPRHRVYLEPFALATRLVTNAEYIEFIEDGGYRRPELWLSDGWDTVRSFNWQAPLYWQQRESAWMQFTLNGLRPVIAAEPVCHVSFYEADAFARWKGCRLPTEAEWEVAADGLPTDGNFVESGRLHPAPAPSAASPSMLQMFGDVWEWTGSAYSPYPGYQPAAGALGEYNGKFMCNQMVLRGGSCATPQSHIRSTYRNFFKPDARWQFMGIRLARSEA